MPTTILPATELRQRMGPILQQVVETNEPVFITRHGRARAVLISVPLYDALIQRQAETPSTARTVDVTLARYERLLSGIDFSERGSAEERRQHHIQVYGELAETRQRANSEVLQDE